MEAFSWLLVFIGRPNAGKSSLIGKLTAINPTVGKKPGSTRKINEYNLSKKFKVVDIPGWGKVHDRAKSYEERVKEDIVTYIEENSFRIPACVLVIDTKSLVDVSERLSKKGIIPIDLELYQFLINNKIKPIVVLNKIDKISKREADFAMSYFKEMVEFEHLSPQLQESFIFTSAKQGTNLGVLRDLIRQRLHESDVEEFERFIKVSK